MSFLNKIVRPALVGVALLAGVAQASAQEVSASHLQVALEVVHSAKANRGYDALLPDIAVKVQDRLIRVRPDLHKVITATVEEAALRLAERRKDLDADIARVWAKHFTEEELKTIAAFYKTPAGVKFADVGAVVVFESMQTAERWGGRVGDELLDNSKKALKSQGIEIR